MRGRKGLMSGSAYPWLAGLLCLVTLVLAPACGQVESPRVVAPRPDASVEPTGAPVTPAAPTDLADLVVELAPVADGFSQPLYLTAPADDTRLFVLEKTGLVRIIDGGSVLGTPFLDLTGAVSTNSERGLLGLAFPKDHAQTGRFYVNYTDKDGTTVISRFQTSDDPDIADPASEEVLLRIEQPYANHNGGCVQIGPDDMLWIGMGDGGSGGDPQGNGQNPSTLLGKMLRLDVGEAGSAPRGEPYGIPADNPWAETADDADPLPEIWALGLRNPWRFSFDRTTGDLWIGDVGQSAYEEIDFVTAREVGTGGPNFGWNIYEGSHPYPPDAEPDTDSADFVMPLIEYGRSAGVSVTGGYVYRGALHPSLAGIYFYGDYGSGRIWGARVGTDGVETRELLDPGLQVVSFGEDANGELYVVDFGGAVYRIVDGETIR